MPCSIRVTASVSSRLRMAVVAMFAIAMSLPAASYAAIPAAERTALVDLYTATNGGAWTTRTNWMGAPGTECTWYGVQCVPGDTSVINIVLQSNNLVGPIPPSIQNLSNLSMLNLFGNALNGSIPSQIGNLPNLYNLQLGQNQLTGSIPPELGNLSSTGFYYLYLYQNQLTGGLPSSLQNLSALRYLWVNGNLLSGNIPTWLGSMTSLQALSLADNDFTGSIPPELGNLVNLNYDLSLSFNQLTGTIPASLGNLTSLRYLFLYGNDLTGSIPPQLSNMTSLQRLELYGNELSGSIPPELGSMPSLQILQLMDNRLTGTIPSSLGNLTTLTQLHLQRNDLSGGIPASLGNLTGLTTLWVSGNMLTGSIPDNLAGLTGVTDLSLGYNALHATGAAKAWADARQPAWAATQTVAPAGVAVPSTTETTATLTWTPITYTANTGRYDVYATAGGPPALVGSTSGKSATGITVSGLSPGTTYTFTVRAVTEPIGFQNHNTVVSDPSSGVAATTPSPSTPPLVLIESNPPPMFAEAGTTAACQFSLANSGGTATTVQLIWDSGFFSVITPAVTLEPGGRATVAIHSTLQPVGAYSGSVMLSGTGVPTGLAAPVTLIVYGPPGADVPDVVPERVRIDVTGPGRLLPGSVAFVNKGSATAVGVALGESAWLIADRTPVEIPPGATKEIPFIVNRDFRDDPSSTDSATTTVHFVYPPISMAKSEALPFSGTGSQPGTSVFDTPPLAGTTSGLPPVSAGQVGFAIPSVRSIPGARPRLLTDVVVGSSIFDSNLGFYLVALGAGAPSAIKASSLVTGPDSPLYLADVVGLGFQKPSSSGSLHFRSSASSSLSIDTMLHAIDDLRGLVAWRDVPVARSDQGAGPGGVLYLPGAGTFLSSGATLWVQEVAGASATYVVDLLDANGVVLATLPSRQLGPFELAKHDLTPSGSTMTMVLRNVVGAGRLSATCEEAGTDLDARALWDASSAFGASRTEELVIPWAASSGKSTSCPSDALCVLGGQFHMTLEARDQRTGRTASGVPVPQNDLFGYFTLPGLTGNSEIPEVFTKILDGRSLNGNYWTFFGGLTDVEYTLRVEDGASGATKTYHKPPGTSQGGFDTGSGVKNETCQLVYPFPISKPPPTAPSARLSLVGGRFRVELAATDPRTGAQGQGVAIPQNDAFGYFSIPALTNNPDNPEVFVKVHDGRAVNGKYWVFFGSLTDFQLNLVVTDTTTGLQRLYQRAGGSACGGYDTESFAATTKTSGSTWAPAAENAGGSVVRTSLAIYSPRGARVAMELRTASRVAIAMVDLAAGRTQIWDDVFTELFSGVAPESGAIFLRPTSGEISAAAWVAGGAASEAPVVATLPVVPTRRAGGVGVDRRFHGVADSSRASIESSVATAVTPMLTLAETVGKPATVEIGVTYATARNLQAVRQSRNVALAARGFLAIDDVVRDILGARRDEAPDLYDATVWIRVVDGEGRVIPALVSRSLSSGDRVVRVR